VTLRQRLAEINPNGKRDKTLLEIGAQIALEAAKEWIAGNCTGRYESADARAIEFEREIIAQLDPADTQGGRDG
jgi:hypothetical protein